MSEGIIDVLSFLEGGFAAINPNTYVPISFPLDLPAPWPPQVFQMSNSVVAAIARSPFTSQMQIQQNAGESWIAQVTLPPLQRADAENWIAWFLMLNGPVGTFLMGDPQASVPRGTVPGTPRVHGANQTGHVLLTSGWTPGIFGIVEVGDYFQLGQRLHKVVRKADSDATGFSYLDIWPRLREIPNDGDPLVFTNPRGLFRLNTSAMSLWTVGNDDYYSIGFTATEAL